MSLARVRDYSTWAKVLAGDIPVSPHDAYYCNVYAGYIWGLSMSDGLRHALRTYRQELAQAHPGIDPNRVTPDNALPGHIDHTKAADYGQPCPDCGLTHRGECY